MHEHGCKHTLWIVAWCSECEECSCGIAQYQIKERLGA